MKHIFFIPIAIIAFFTSCKKPVQNNDIQELNSLFDAQKSPITLYTIDASQSHSIKSPKGARIIIDPNSFVNQNGQPIVGNINLSFVECYTPADMIFSKVLPISNTNLLHSGGEFKLTASQNGQPLKMAPGKTFQVKLPQFGANNTIMDLFFGEPIQNVAANDANLVNWNLFEKDSSTNQANLLICNGDTIDVFCDSLEWANADRYINNPNYKNFTVTITGVDLNEKNNSTKAYAIYDDYNGAWPMYASGSNIIAENHVPDIPVHFVVFGVYDGKLMAGSVGATPADNANYTVNLKEISKEDLRSLMNSF